VAEYTSDLRHLAGKDNVIADALSRPPGHAVGESSPAAAGVKAPSGSLVAARQGDKPNSSTSAAVMAVAAADHARKREWTTTRWRQSNNVVGNPYS
jgi:hypothetical protein